MDGEEKLWRYGLLANELVARGHKVTRWAPTFEHVHKRQRFLNNRTVCLNEKYKIEFLFAKGYQKNISFARLRFNRKIAQSFSQALFQEKKPDVIVAGIPTPEMTAVAIDFGRRVGIPVIVDIRDLWPEIYLIVLPRPFRGFGRLALIPSFNKMKRIMRRAAAIIGVSESYLAWGVALAGRKRRDTDRVFPLGYSEKVIEPRLLEGEREKWIKSGADPKKFICCFFGQFEASYDLETVIDHLKLKRVALLGTSCGGPTAIAYATRYPRQVSHLILYGTYASGQELGTNEVRKAFISLVRAHWGIGSKTIADLFSRVLLRT